MSLCHCCTNCAQGRNGLMQKVILYVQANKGLWSGSPAVGDGDEPMDPIFHSLGAVTAPLRIGISLRL